jgi:hypothetical protein
LKWGGYSWAGRNRRSGTVSSMWLPGLRPARHKATVWVPARPEVVIRWLCDPDRRQRPQHADLGPWELVEGPTFEPLTSGGLRVRFSVRYSKWTVSRESVDGERTARSFSRRIVSVRSRVGARRRATSVAWLRVDANEEAGGANLTAHVMARLVGRARLFVLLGFHDTAWAKVMLGDAHAVCQRVVAVVLQEFAAPPSFNEELTGDWSLWVLDHGLPPLPDRVGFGESVPIAYWAGPQIGAVLHIQATAADPHAGEPARFDTEVTCFRRVGDHWDAADAGGGTDWPAGASLARIQVAPGYVGFGGELNASGDGPVCTAVEGVVGDNARWIEVTDPAGTIRRPVDAPVGVIVIGIPAARPVTIRVLDSADREIARHVME